MTQPIVPDADQGGRAMSRIAKHLVFGIVGGVAACFSLMGAVFGGIAFLITGSTMLLGASGIAGCAAAAALTIAALRIRHTTKHNAPHIEAWSLREEQAKQRLQEPAPKTQPSATKEFNPEAAVRLKKDIKTMRPLKLNSRPSHAVHQVTP